MKKAICPICNKEYEGYPALSRRADMEICPECGQKEAFDDYINGVNRNKSLKKSVLDALTNDGVRVNKLAFTGISRKDGHVTIDRVVISLEVPNDDDVARVLRVRQDLEGKFINLINVLIEL